MNNVENNFLNAEQTYYFQLRMIDSKNVILNMLNIFYTHQCLNSSTPFITEVWNLN